MLSPIMKVIFFLKKLPTENATLWPLHSKVSYVISCYLSNMHLYLLLPNISSSMFFIFQQLSFCYNMNKQISACIHVNGQISDTMHRGRYF